MTRFKVTPVDFDCVRIQDTEDKRIDFVATKEQSFDLRCELEDAFWEPDGEDTYKLRKENRMLDDLGRAS